MTKYFTICTIAKDEDPYVDEFVDYHKLVGAEHIVIYDRSQSPLSTHFAGRSDMTVVAHPEPNTHQQAWSRYNAEFRNLSKWTAFIDIDQFLVPYEDHHDMRELLRDYENYAALAVHWQSFGSAGHETMPNGVIENFLMRAKADHGLNGHIQTIAQSARCQAIPFGDPHRLVLNHGEIMVDENFRQVTNSIHPPPTQRRFALNHYITKSKEEFYRKIRRGRADIPGQMHDDTWIDLETFCNEERDERALSIWKNK